MLTGSQFLLFTRNTAVVESVVPHILSKTQHKYPNIREYALKMLATLILEDYLKMRGSLLIYIMASFLDTLPQIRELAMELVLKYTLEKNEAFLCTCLLECPFVFNGCAYLGQSATARSASENVLRGMKNQAPREYIYRYLMKKIDSVQLYMYYTNFSKLAEYVEKSRTLPTSDDEQTAIADFLFICTEICVFNAKHKRSVDKIVRATQNGEKPAADDHQLEMEAEAQLAAEAGVGTGSGRGGRNKKNQTTMAQSLVVVERQVPHIVQVSEALLSMNATRFEPITTKLCSELCGHFEAIFEYAQPREFWTKYIEISKKKVPPTPTAPKRMAASHLPDVGGSDEPPEPSLPVPDTSQTSQMLDELPSGSAIEEANDSGLYTMDDSFSRCSYKTTASTRRPLSEHSSIKTQRSSSSRKLPLGGPSKSSRQTPSAGPSSSRSTRHNPRRRIIDDDSDDDSVISGHSTASKISRISATSSVSMSKPSTSKKPLFTRKRR